MSTSTHLVRDGALILQTDAGCESAVASWIPRYRANITSNTSQKNAIIHARAADDSMPSHTALRIEPQPTLMLAGIDCWINGNTAYMRGRHSAAHGVIDLRAMHADIYVPHESGDIERADVFSMLTLSSALLLARMNRSLVHTAAVLLPDNRVWLLAGDAYAGKTTTTLNLMRNGCRYLSDDQVILSLADSSSEVGVEGWPRNFHVDTGWQSGSPVGERIAVDPEMGVPSQWISNGILGGLLFPHVNADGPTEMRRIAPVDALARLIRQSPWVMTQIDVAPAILEVLTAAALMPAFDLSVGLDTYRDHQRLATILESCNSQ